MTRRGGRKSGYSGYYFHIGAGSGEEYPCRSFLAVVNYYTEPKLKNFCLSGHFDDKHLDINHICEVFKSAKPFLDYINRAIEYSREEL